MSEAFQLRLFKARRGYISCQKTFKNVLFALTSFLFPSGFNIYSRKILTRLQLNDCLYIDSYSFLIRISYFNPMQRFQPLNLFQLSFVFIFYFKINILVYLFWHCVHIRPVHCWFQIPFAVFCILDILSHFTIPPQAILTFQFLLSPSAVPMYFCITDDSYFYIFSLFFPQHNVKESPLLRLTLFQVQVTFFYYLFYVILI